MNTQYGSQYKRGFVSLEAGLQYIELPKCACTAIKACLLKSDGHQVRDGGHAHCHEAFEKVPKEWQPRHIFTFCRNPLDRLVSNYAEKLQKGLAHRLKGNCQLSPDATFLEWARWVCTQDPRQVDRHWAPQSIILGRQPLKPHFILQFEEIQRGWRELQRLAWNNLVDLERWNVSQGKGPWQDYYCDESLQLAAAFYAPDFERFSYTPHVTEGPDHAA